MPLWKKLVLGLGGSALAILWHAWSAAFTVGTVHRFGLWAYPINIGYALLLSAAALLASRSARLARKIAIDPRRLEKPFWRWSRERGAFAFVLLATLLGGAFFAVAVIRFLALPERKAWSQAFMADAACNLLVVSFYLGLLDILRSHLASVVRFAGLH